MGLRFSLRANRRVGLTATFTAYAYALPALPPSRKHSTPSVTVFLCNKICLECAVIHIHHACRGFALSTFEKLRTATFQSHFPFIVETTCATYGYPGSTRFQSDTHEHGLLPQTRSPSVYRGIQVSSSSSGCRTCASCSISALTVWTVTTLDASKKVLLYLGFLQTSEKKASSLFPSKLRQRFLTFIIRTQKKSLIPMNL